ncbi:MAG: hypothetical protein ACYDEX_06865 [Mobilitalea sp.]
MSTFVELDSNEIMNIDGGGWFLEKVAWAAAALDAGALSSACFGAIVATAPVLATAGLVVAGLGFGVVACYCIGGLIFD